jgi:hypothetical protein
MKGFPKFLNTNLRFDASNVAIDIEARPKSAPNRTKKEYKLVKFDNSTTANIRYNATITRSIIFPKEVNPFFCACGALPTDIISDIRNTLISIIRFQYQRCDITQE